MRSVRSARRDLPDAVVTGRFKRFDAVGCSDRIEEVRIWGRGGRCLSAPLSWGVAMAERMAGACNRIVQKARVRKDGWTITRRRKFLNALGETCNVRHACEVAGLSQRSAYDLRQRDVTCTAVGRGAYAGLRDAGSGFAFARIDRGQCDCDWSADRG